MFAPAILCEYWNPLVERCGLVLDDDTVIEIPNTAATPENDFSFPRSYFDHYSGCVATWHTHPKNDPNLSIQDYKVFLTQPNLFHYIATDGIVWGFYVRNNKVFLYEDDSISRLFEGTLP